MKDACRDAEDLFAEPGDDVGRNPGRAEPGRDLRGFQVLRRSVLERLDVALKSRILERGVDGDLELLADRPGEIGVGGPPGLEAGAPGLRVEEYAVPELRDRRLARDAEKLGDAVEIDHPGLVQRDRERVGGARDLGRNGRMEHPLGEDRALPGDAGLGVVVLDRGDEPDVGIVEEGLKVRPADGLADFAVWSCGLADRRQVDRAELPLEMRISRAQPDLRPAPGEIGFLGAQNLANSVANLDEAPDDARMPRRDAVRALAVADRNGDGHAVDNLGEPVLDDEVAALLDRRAFGRGSDADGLVDERLALEPRRGWRRIDVGGKRVERGEQVLKQGIRFGADRQTGIGRAIGARGPRVRSEDHVRMLDEVAIDRERLFTVLRGHDFGEVDPVGGLRRLIRSALLEEQDVDDDVGSGRRAHGAFGQADGADEIGHGGEKHAGRRIGLVHGPAARDEGREAARP